MRYANGLRWWVAFGVALMWSPSAPAGYNGGAANGGVSGTYDVELLVGGSDSVSATPNETVTVEVVMTPQAGDLRIGVAIFDLSISNGGLRYDDHEWNPLYFSTSCTSDTCPYPPPEIETNIHFENLTITGDNLFPSGTLVSLDLTVPDVATPGSAYEIAYHHDTLTEDGLFYHHDANVLGPLTINVVPEPTTVVLVGAGALIALCRRSKR